MKNIKTTLSKLYAYFSIALAFTMCGITPAFASDDVFEVGNQITDNLITKISDFYCDKLFLLLLVVNLVLLAFTKNEKKTALYQKTLITIVVVYVVLQFSTRITGFIDGLINVTP